MELLKIKYRKPKQVFEVALYTRKDGILVELEGKGYARQKCKMIGGQVSFPTAIESWPTVYSCGFIRGGVTYMVSLDREFCLTTGETLSITVPNGELK